MSAGVTYTLFDEEGKVTLKQESVACFSSLFFYGKVVGKGSVIYHPHILCSQEEAIEFLSDMGEVGFLISNAREIVENGSYELHGVDESGKPRGQMWINANLTLVRYVSEFTRVIWQYLALKKILPEADKFYLLQLAHFSSLPTLSRGNYYGNGHSLVDTTFGKSIVRFAKWGDFDQVKYKTVQSMFHPKLSERYFDNSPEGIKEAYEKAKDICS